MKELFGYSMLALCAGILLNFVPCVLPVIPLKVRAVLREIKGDIRSRVLAAASLFCGSLFFFLLLGGATAYLGLTWGALFQSKAFLAALSTFLFFAAIATLSEHRPVLLEFTAEWCLNCKILDKTSYADKKVVQAARNVKLATYRVDMTDFNEDHKALLEKFGGTALPYALLIDGNGNVIRRFAGMFTGKTLAEATERLTTNYKKSVSH